jgi:hypothetical protein
VALHALIFVYSQKPGLEVIVRSLSPRTYDWLDESSRKKEAIKCGEGISHELNLPTDDGTETIMGYEWQRLKPVQP